MAAIDQMNLAVTPAFVRRVCYSLVKSAVQIKNEGAVTFHGPRAVWAGVVLANPSDTAWKVAVAVATQAALQGAVTVVGTSGQPETATTTATDTDIDNAVSALWNALSGAL